MTNILALALIALCSFGMTGCMLFYPFFND